MEQVEQYQSKSHHIVKRIEMQLYLRYINEHSLLTWITSIPTIYLPTNIEH